MDLDDASARAPGPPRMFDVVCAGASSLVVGADGTMRVGGGAARTALALARHDLRAGLATVLGDDTTGRAIRTKIAATGVDVGGLVLAPPSSGLLFVRGGALQSLGEGREAPPVAIPEGWSSSVLLLSGMSPAISHAAALCKAARAARRVGTIVVVDLHADWSEWKGRNWRSVRMLLGEADVVWASSEDLAGLSLDPPSVRAAMRRDAVFVRHHVGRVSATGRFGEVSHPSKLGPVDADDDFVAAIAFELVHAQGSFGTTPAIWSRALARGHAAVVRTRR
ncbi:MAG: PfkB family carbohydrate kinase [Polyangiaceae bacterium]